jgi:hypothetical protein
MKPTPPPRLSVLQAPKADVGVIFRRGPSKRVEVVRWDMRHDRLERGQWFKGRIYTRRSDLSPDGQLLVYFASKFNSKTINDREYTYAWTAVSRPPWLTALALWPKEDCWWGGGMFTAKRELLLNHRPAEAEPHPKHKPRGLVIVPNVEARGEDDPLYTRRLERDGWKCTQVWDFEWGGYGLFYQTRVPEHRERKHPQFPFAIRMERRLDGLTYSERFSIRGSGQTFTLPNGRVEWVDWDSRGRAFVLAEGRLLVADVTSAGPGQFEVVEDFAAHSFEERESPATAARW